MENIKEYCAKYKNKLKEEISKLAMRQSDERIADEVLKLIER